MKQFILVNSRIICTKH